MYLRCYSVQIIFLSYHLCKFSLFIFISDYFFVYLQLFPFRINFFLQESQYQLSLYCIWNLSCAPISLDITCIFLFSFFRQPFFLILLPIKKGIKKTPIFTLKGKLLSFYVKIGAIYFLFMTILLKKFRNLNSIVI